MMDLNEISLCLQNGNARGTSALVNKAIEENYDIESIVKKGFVAGMKAVTERYRRQDIIMPEICLARRAMNHGIRQVKLALAASDKKWEGTVVIGMVSGENEETTKNLISIMLESMGIRVIDLGPSVGAEQFVEAAIAEKAQLIICSAMLVSTMPRMKLLVRAATAAGIRTHTKILITGAPVTEQYSRLIGADFYAPDAEGAADKAVHYCLQAGGSQKKQE
jgi:5-methyltetrahydrofolate--homocysteine methyltransferase